VARRAPSCPRGPRFAWRAAFVAGALGAALPLASTATAAAAAPAAKAPSATSIVLLRTAVAEGDAIHAARAGDADLENLARTLDALLSDTAQDLGFSVVPPPAGALLADADLRARARAAACPVLLPSLRATSTGDVEIRLALADPRPAGGPVEVRIERVARADLPVRAVVLLRDLVARRVEAPAAPPLAASAPAPSSIWRSPGSLSLMASSTVFGGFVGGSVQAASGSNDPRVLVPLIIVGAGVGLGASWVAASEWDVGLGDAWYFVAGAAWPTLAGQLIFQGRFSADRPSSDRWVFGLVGGGAGATIATLGLALHTMSGADALVAHSGGGLGLALGSLVEIAARGDTREVPYAGMGYGAALGWLGAAALAVQVRTTPLRVALVDAGVVAGGLVGAGAASPLLVGGASPTRTRAWAAITAGTALGGGVAGLLAPRSAEPRRLAGLPFAGVLGESRAGTRSAPIVGVGWAGTTDGAP
jgi:hypothetical protein